ncbi:hypothetical protein [Fusobacterium sp.]|uniref:hypothetical protein n=1 Tax=Fusobacterium sp. TaxID=68766 RepID=UPI002639B4A9|nr:hypothetical protein [Fusobacterium sp.]
MKIKNKIIKLLNKKAVIIILEKIIEIIDLQLFFNRIFKGRVMSDKTRIILKGVFLILSLIKNFLELKKVNIKILIEIVIYLFDL